MLLITVNAINSNFKLQYNLELLKQKCEDKLLEDLEIETVVRTLVCAELHNCSELKKVAAKLVKM